MIFLNASGASIVQSQTGLPHPTTNRTARKISNISFARFVAAGTVVAEAGK